MNNETIRKMAQVVGSDVSFDETRCLHARAKAVDCRLCVDFCPTGAISDEGGISRDPELCVRCGLCLHVCPIGAFTGKDRRVDLLSSALVLQRKSGASALELTCKSHPGAETGPADSGVVVRLTHCLGDLSPSAYLALFSLGYQDIRLRVELCHGCPLGHALEGIKHAAEQARRILDAAGVEGAITLCHHRQPEWLSRQVYDARSSYLSRRDMLRIFADENPRNIANKLAAGDFAPGEEAYLPLERVRLLRALDALHISEQGALPDNGLPFGMLSADDSCSACGICVKGCLTGALGFYTDSEQNRFYLTFTPGACIDCGICLHYCEPEALTRETGGALKDALSLDMVVLRSGEFRTCRKCGVKFAAQDHSTMCRLCSFRRDNPFGATILRDSGRKS